jgi:hypothetical protein
MTKKIENPNQPKSLTTEQRSFVDKLVTRFGDKHTNIKRKELKKASQEILHLAAAPSWITSNMKVRNKEKRGMYDLSALLKLPVVAFKDVKKVKKVKKVKEPLVGTPVEGLDGISLFPPITTAQLIKKTRKKKEPEVEMVSTQMVDGEVTE